MITIYKVNRKIDLRADMDTAIKKTEYFLNMEDANSFINSLTGNYIIEDIEVWEPSELSPLRTRIKEVLSALTEEEKKELKNNINLFI